MDATNHDHVITCPTLFLVTVRCSLRQLDDFVAVRSFTLTDEPGTQGVELPIAVFIVGTETYELGT